MQAFLPIETYTPEKYMKKFVGFLLKHSGNQTEISRILLRKEENHHFGLNLSCIDLINFSPTLAQLVIFHANELLPVFDESIRQAEKKLLERHQRKAEMIFKYNVHARLGHIPRCDELNKVVMPKCDVCYWYDLYSIVQDIGKFQEVEGTVIRTGEVKMMEWERNYECASCKHRFIVNASIEQRNVFPKVYECPSYKDPPCIGKQFKVIEDSGKCRDYQEIKIQEHIGKLGVGSMPRSLIVVLTDDLVDSCKAGDEIRVNGIVKRRWGTLFEEERCDIEVFMEANWLTVINEQRFGVNLTDELVNDFKLYWEKHKDKPLLARNEILKSVCPQIFGLYIVKLSVMLALIGGVRKQEKNGLNVRGESHLLLIGEPGTGKSQFLKYAAMLAPRSVLTTGIGTTSAGLTVSAVKETGGDWILEAGALVLADGGVCCIDEFSGIKERDRSTIHEAMEQQTLSVAKAGLVCKLQTRTTVIAATNPKGKYDPTQSLSVNIAVASPLLSRFDLVLLLLDDRNLEWDRRVSSYILQGLIDNEMDEGMWSLPVLRAYIAHVKTFKPEITKEAALILTGYYKRQRQCDLKNSARTTIRMLESLIRLAQAHARLMFRNVVTIQDAVLVVYLMESSMLSSAMLGVSSPMHSLFPQNPDEEYSKIEASILKQLKLSQLGAVPTASQYYQNPNESHSPISAKNDKGFTDYPIDDSEDDEPNQKKAKKTSNTDDDGSDMVYRGDLDISFDIPDKGQNNSLSQSFSKFNTKVNSQKSTSVALQKQKQSSQQAQQPTKDNNNSNNNNHSNSDEEPLANNKQNANKRKPDNPPPAQVATKKSHNNNTSLSASQTPNWPALVDITSQGIKSSDEPFHAPVSPIIKHSAPKPSPPARQTPSPPPYQIPAPASNAPVPSPSPAQSASVPTNDASPSVGSTASANSTKKQSAPTSTGPAKVSNSNGTITPNNANGEKPPVPVLNTTTKPQQAVLPQTTVLDNTNDFEDCFDLDPEDDLLKVTGHGGWSARPTSAPSSQSEKNKVQPVQAAPANKQQKVVESLLNVSMDFPSSQNQIISPPKKQATPPAQQPLQTKQPAPSSQQSKKMVIPRDEPDSDDEPFVQVIAKTQAAQPKKQPVKTTQPAVPQPKETQQAKPASPPLVQPPPNVDNPPQPKANNMFGQYKNNSQKKLAVRATEDENVANPIEPAKSVPAVPDNTTLQAPVQQPIVSAPKSPVIDASKTGAPQSKQDGKKRRRFLSDDAE